MSDPGGILERLAGVLQALERISRRFAAVRSPADFTLSDEGLDRPDAICMSLVPVGEAFKNIDRRTGGEFLARYPAIDWSGVKGVRDVIAHGYFELDTEAIFAICQNDIPVLTGTVRSTMEDLT